MDPEAFYDKFKELLDSKFFEHRVEIGTQLRRMKTMDKVYSSMDSLNYDRVEKIEKDMETIINELQEIKVLIGKNKEGRGD